jgi:hypothetical protein
VLFGRPDLGLIISETWEWDGSTWTQMATTGPSVRTGQAVAYDSQRGRTVLFGGQPSYGYSSLGDTWEWDGSSWTQVSAVGPPPRYGHTMAYDSQRSRTVLFGGKFLSQPPSNPTIWLWRDDTWEWDGGSWVQVATTGPGDRVFTKMAYDSHRWRTVLFGGFAYPVLGDTWEWEGELLSVATSFGAGCGSPALALAPVVAARPTINTTPQVALMNVPSSLAFVSLGLSRTSYGPFVLPMSLLPFGLPGCDLLQSADAVAQPAAITGPGTAIYGLPLPNWGGLLGQSLYLQGWAVAPGVNPIGVIVSNGVEWFIGNA